MNRAENEVFGTLVDPRKKGLGGFLLLLWLSVSVLRPASTLWYVITIVTTEHPAAGYVAFAWVLVNAALNVAFAALGVYAGVLLWRLDPRGPRVTTVYFLIALGFRLLHVLTSLRYGVGFVFATLVRTPLLFDLGWLAYLKLSRRVRLTYGSGEQGGPVGLKGRQVV